MPEITVLPTQRSFSVNGKETLLESALRAGFALNYGCSNGNCGLCKAKLVHGEIERVRHHDYVIPAAEKLAGTFLMCSNTALADATIETQEATDVGDIPVQTIAAKVKKAVTVNQHLMFLTVQLPRTNRLRFLAGQRATLSFKNDYQTTLPIASCPCEERILQFHMQPLPDLRLSAGTPVTITGPYGEFILEESLNSGLLFLAYETGIAPIKSLIEHAFAIEWEQPIHLYWFADDEENHDGSGHYLHNLIRSWQDVFEDFYYMPMSKTELSQNSTKFLAQLPLREWMVYSAGSAPFVQTMDTMLAEQNVRAIQRFQEIVD